MASFFRTNGFVKRGELDNPKQFLPRAGDVAGEFISLIRLHNFTVNKAGGHP
jgi:hypothetical protein